MKLVVMHIINRFYIINVYLQLKTNYVSICLNVREVLFMLKLFAKTVKCTIDLQLAYTLTLVARNSGTGKTYLCSLIEKCKDTNILQVYATNQLNYTVNVVKTLNDLRCIVGDNVPHLIFIDNMAQWDIPERSMAEDIILEDLRKKINYNYYVIMYRGVSKLGYVEPKYILEFSNNTFTLVVGGQVKCG